MLYLKDNFVPMRQPLEPFVSHVIETTQPMYSYSIYLTVLFIIFLAAILSMSYNTHLALTPEGGNVSRPF